MKLTSAKHQSEFAIFGWDFWFHVHLCERVRPGFAYQFSSNGNDQHADHQVKGVLHCLNGTQRGQKSGRAGGWVLCFEQQG